MKSEGIERLLPSVFRRTVRPGTPIAAILDVMEGLHDPCEQILAHLDERFDPRRAPARMVPFLARWVDLQRIFDPLIREDASGVAVSDAPLISTGTGRLRELVAAAARLSQERGTREGLLRFLKTATGASGFRIPEDVTGEDDRPIPFHIRVEAPEDVRIHEGLIRRIIEQEKPAHVTYELQFVSS